MKGDQDLLHCLFSVSAKAGRIAQVCREDEHLLALLVEEKKASEKNPRFLHDFKTLADVLVQEVIKHQLSSKFPAFEGHVYGEESNEFSNGETNITVQVKETEAETADLLNQVLNDSDAAVALANVIHAEVEADINVPVDGVDLTWLPDALGLWIDPIDSTSEYIQGRRGKNEGNLVTSGLPCVTVLVGVFDRDTGSPLIGVVNQPFAVENDGRWSCRYYYGINISEHKLVGPSHHLSSSEKLVAISNSEDAKIREALIKNGYTLVEVTGAGYKLLKIITGEVHAYVLSKPTTFLWDTCACHAILEAVGGGIIDYTTKQPIRYKTGYGVQECCNKGGIIAFRSNEICDSLVKILKLVE